MKKVITTLVLSVFLLGNVFAYTPTQKDKIIMKKITTIVKNLKEKQKKTLKEKLPPILKKIKKDTRNYYIISSLLEVVNKKENYKISHAIRPVIIYKTRNNYDKFVPINLSENKLNIISYPGPYDVFYGGKLAYPTKLVNWYLLDNRGINTNSAFLNITYEEYSKLQEAPTESFLSMIKDANPFIEIYECHKYVSYEKIEKINKLIKENKLWEKCENLFNK